MSLITQCSFSYSETSRFRIEASIFSGSYPKVSTGNVLVFKTGLCGLYLKVWARALGGQPRRRKPAFVTHDNEASLCEGRGTKQCSHNRLRPWHAAVLNNAHGLIQNWEYLVPSGLSGVLCPPALLAADIPSSET